MVVISIMIIIITQLWLIKNYFNLKELEKDVKMCIMSEPRREQIPCL